MWLRVRDNAAVLLCKVVQLQKMLDSGNVVDLEHTNHQLFRNLLLGSDTEANACALCISWDQADSTNNLIRILKVGSNQAKGFHCERYVVF